MIALLLWSIYLLTYSYTKSALFGSRLRFDVNGLVQTWVSATKIEYFDGNFVSF